ncbi:CDP-diacylglycerol--glycerol-3-phosphate 3-phosphatidyltransferase [compost metagenome]
MTLVLTREFLITGLRTAAINAGVVLAASWTGKVKTTLQMVAIAFLIAGIHPWGDWLWWAAIVMTAYSGLEYIWQTRRIWV